MKGLKEVISIKIGVSSNSECIPGLCLGRVDFLITKAEVTKFIIGVELAGCCLKGGGNGAGPMNFRGVGVNEIFSKKIHERQEELALE